MLIFGHRNPLARRIAKRLNVAVLSVAFETAGDGGGGGGGGNPPTPPAPNPELARLKSERDAAKRQVALFAATLGIDPADVTIVETGDAENPYRLEAPGLADITEAIKAKKKPVKWEEQERTLQAAHQRRVKELTDAKDGEIQSRDAYVRELAVNAQIRAAAAAEKAVDHDQTGNYDDLVALVAPRVRTTVQRDEESGRLKVTVSPMNEDGTPMLDGKGNPVTVRQLVAAFLAKRPHLKQAGFRSGPGAGGAGTGGGQQQNNGNNGNNSGGNPASVAGRRFFGLS